MVDRINLILKAKNLTSRQFAEEIGIQPSGMSHILSGRNRPSLDFVMKVVSRYPEIDIKWLTLGEGEMYSSNVPVKKIERRSQPDLFSAMEEESIYGNSSMEPETIVKQEQTAVMANESTLSSDAPSSPVLPSEQLSNMSSLPLSSASASPSLSPSPSSSSSSSSPSPSSSSSSPSPSHSSSPSSSSFSPSFQELSSFQSAPISTPEPVKRSEQVEQIQPVENDRQTDVERPNSGMPIKKIVKVVMFYDDHTFAEYYPE